MAFEREEDLRTRVGEYLYPFSELAAGLIGIILTAMRLGIGPDFQPSKVVCVGRNYAEHAAELGNDVPKEPLLFLKAPSAIICNGDKIVIPEYSHQVEHEGELAVIIGDICKDLPDDADISEYIRGYTCLND